MPTCPMVRPLLRRAALVALVIAPPFAAAGAQARFDVKEHYQKYEYQIPMRDGVKLFTSVYVPRDSAATWPILLSRTPYSAAPYGVEAYPPFLGPGRRVGIAGLA